MKEVLMKDRDLKKLNRAELLKLLIDQMTENEMLRDENERLNTKLADRQILLENAGSIAEAALKVNGVFEAAEAAAAQYLENIIRAQAFAQESAAVVTQRAETILNDAQEDAQKLLLDAQQEAQNILINAREESQRIRREAVRIWSSFTQSPQRPVIGTKE